MLVFVYENPHHLTVENTAKYAVGYPTQEALDAYGIDLIASKDVPHGVPFKILDHTDLPTTPQEEWVFDSAYFDSGIGGEETSF